MRKVHWHRKGVILEKQIEKDVQALVIEQFNINADKEDNLYLLGIMPRDMVKLVYLLEDKYGIQFSESDLLHTTFDSIHNLAVAVNHHIQN